MKFGDIPLSEAEGAILAHAVQVGSELFKKGRVITERDIAQLRRAGLATVTAAKLDASDVSEDEAAFRIATANGQSQLRLSAASTGRVNIYAAAAGLALIDKDKIDAANTIDESITIASVPAFEPVKAGDMLATVKIIPFAAPVLAVAHAERILPGAIGLAPYSHARVGLISTSTPTLKPSLIAKNKATVETRLRSVQAELLFHIECAHNSNSIADAISKALTNQPDILLVFGATATTDRRDTVPAAMEKAGATLERFGMPVDPGNLLVLGRHGNCRLIGLPGCARSPKLNGLDFVLQRLAAGLTITAADISRMGVGGLLKEIPSRPQPREAAGAQTTGGTARVAAIILAAGQSKRMGPDNKLLRKLGGIPMIVRTLRAVKAALPDIYVVTGHESEKLLNGLEGEKFTPIPNPDYADGMSTSLKAGIKALPSTVDAAMICLGDMPAMRDEDLKNMISAFDPDDGRGIIIPVFNGKRGNPVLFARKYFSEILATQGDTGARTLLAAHADDVYEVEASAGVLADADTPEAFAAMENQFKA